MTEQEKADEVRAHETSCMLEGAPAELDAGRIMALKVQVSCSSACDLRGKTAKIIAQDAVVKEMEIELTEFDGVVTETDEFVVKAPTKPGGYTWTAVFPAQEKEGVLHGESSAPFSFIVKSHITSMTVWDVPSPIVLNARFKLKVGVSCSAKCKLTGKDIEIYDQEGGKVATSTLGDVPWSDTTAVYWAEVELKAPGTEGFYTWEVKFPKPDLQLPHEEAAYTFAFTTARPPEHVVTVEVIDKRKKTPIKNAQVLLHSGGATYRKRTDERGVVKVGLPKGGYDVDVLADGYERLETTAEVAGDATIKAELLRPPQDW